VISDRGLPFEVQIRTEEMHRIAEEGIAAHWKYKEGRKGASNDEQYFRWLRQLLEWQQEVRDPHEFIQNLKIDLYPEEVYCFTPRGEVKALPRGATPVDFAYAIHTDIGHQCVGARVNGAMVPLRHKLTNGDIVEIITQTGHKPSRDWMNFLTTSRARQKVRHHIQTEEKTRSIELGKRLFEKEARRFDLNAKTLSDEAVLKAAAEHGLHKLEDLYAAVGYGKLSPRQVFLKIMPAEQLREKPAETGLVSMVRRVWRPGEDKIKVRGIDDLLVNRARCCNPIRGEKIVGYISRGKGVSVHSATCANVVNLQYDPERRIEVEWDKGEGAAPAYTVKLKVQVEDKKGMLAAISTKVSGMNSNIKNMEATTEDQRGQIDMTVEISDMKHLEKVIKSIRGVSGVIDVARIYR
jgi:guanosine-3',5'-bis(diphosphate) 3'-pyrophosphohydrolase